MIASLRLAIIAAATVSSSSISASRLAEDAHRLMQAGEYAQAARALSAEAMGKHADFEDELLLADANERAEGSYMTTESALDAADRLSGAGPAAPPRHLRVALIRALLQSRQGHFELAARTVVGARDAIGKDTADADLPVAVSETYGIVLLRMGLSKEAYSLLLDVVDRRMKSLHDGAPRLLEALYWLGYAEYGLKMLPEAQATLRETVRIRTLTGGASHPETLSARLMLANALAHDAPGDAIRERRWVAQQWSSRHDQHDARAVAAMIAVGNDEAANGGARGSLATYRAAYDLATTSDPPIERLTAEAGLKLAKALLALGQYGEALGIIADLSTRSPQIRDSPLAYDIQVTRAVLYSELKRPQDAEPIYRQLIAVYDADPTLSRLQRLTLVNNLAETLASQGRFAEAVTPQREVADARCKLLGPADPATLAAKSSLASFLADQSPPSLEEAIKLHREVLAARRAKSPPDQLAIASSLHNLAATLDLAKAYPEAKHLATEAVDLRSKALGVDHPDTITSRRQLAGILFSSGDIADAQETYRQIVVSLERSRIAATSTDDQRRNFFAGFAQVYKWLAVMQAHSGSASALAYADAGRARTLDEFTTSSDALNAIASQPERERLASARASLGRLESVSAADLSPTERDVLHAKLDAAAALVSRTESDLQTKHPQLRFASAFRPLDKEKLRKALGDGSLLLDYIVIGDRVQLLWMAPDGTMGASPLGRLPALSETARAYVALLSAPALSGTSSDPMTDRAVFAWPDGSYRLRRLDEPIPEAAGIVSDIAPIRQTLSAALLGDLPASARLAKRWIIVPDGPLAGIPFDTLALDGHLVVESSAVSYVPSLQLLLDLHDRLASYRASDRDALLVIGAPSFRTAPSDSLLRNWKELPGSKAELDDLTRRYHLLEGQTLFSAGNATELRLRQLDRDGSLAHYKTLYFSTHGMIDLATSNRNAIVLLGDGKSPESDGFVRAAELMSMNSRADLVVVSACESGVGEWLDGEGAMGLPYSLFAAGAASTLLTHWSVPDRSSSAFMARFFDKLDRGANLATALQQTKLDFMSGKAGASWTAPGYWAPFDVFGAMRL